MAINLDQVVDKHQKEITLFRKSFKTINHYGNAIWSIQLFQKLNKNQRSAIQMKKTGRKHVLFVSIQWKTKNRQLSRIIEINQILRHNIFIWFEWIRVCDWCGPMNVGIKIDCSVNVCTLAVANANTFITQTKREASKEWQQWNEGSETTKAWIVVE